MGVLEEPLFVDVGWKLGLTHGQVTQWLRFDSVPALVPPGLHAAF